MKLPVAVLVAALSGFLALSYEVLWVRVCRYATADDADTFGFVLAAYLTGLAVGGLIAHRLCRASPASSTSSAKARRDVRRVAVALFAASAAAYLVIPAVAALVVREGRLAFAGYAVIAAAAVLFGSAFPLVAEAGVVDGEGVGAGVSYLYVGNIAGAAAGGLTTGYALLDLLPLSALPASLAAVGIAMSAALLLTGAGGVRKETVGSGLVVMLALVVGTQPILYRHVYERLYWKGSYDGAHELAAVVEGKSGVVAVTHTGVVVGDGFYDGVYNTSPEPSLDRNRVLRAYAVPLFMAPPRRVLIVGLGSGSWLQVLANLPGVEQITAVELNPGYAALLQTQPAVASVLENPKVHIVVDDGRRFLRRDGERYDLIVQNSTGYWRSHVTNVLSREYLEIVRAHLAAGGVFYLNTTSSAAVQKTVATGFAHALRFQNMMIGSDAPLVLDRPRWRAAMEAWRIDGAPAVDMARDGEAIEAELFSSRPWRGAPIWEERAAILERTAAQPVVTDDNMATEWFAWSEYPSEPPRPGGQSE